MTFGDHTKYLLMMVKISFLLSLMIVHDLLGSFAQNKSEVTFTLPQIFSMVLTQFDTRIKIIQSDNASELKVANLCAE